MCRNGLERRATGEYDTRRETLRVTADEAQASHFPPWRPSGRIGGIVLGRYALRRLDERCALVVRTISDRIIPGHGDVPGAVALGIDREILEVFRKTRRTTSICSCSPGARGHRFLHAGRRPSRKRSSARTAAERRRQDDDDDLQECVRRYLTRTEAWAALGYRTPQPHGYPDYTQCGEA